MLAPLVRELINAELPALEAHGLSMWGYIVLGALDRSPVRSQAALAEVIGADKTRIIPTLDELQERGYIERRPDPDDRRVRPHADPRPRSLRRQPLLRAAGDQTQPVPRLGRALRLGPRRPRAADDRRAADRELELVARLRADVVPRDGRGGADGRAERRRAGGSRWTLRTGGSRDSDVALGARRSRWPGRADRARIALRSLRSGRP